MTFQPGVACALVAVALLFTPSFANAQEPCTSLTLSRTTYYSGAGSAFWSVKVTAPTSDCTWSAAIDRGVNDPSAWLILNGNPAVLTASGTGSGTVTLQTLSNTTGAFRYGTFTIGGATPVTYKVTQEKPADTIKPTVAIASPAADSVISGVVEFSATASDNVSVKGVLFKVNGINLAPEDTAAPYALSWNTAAISDGLQTLSVVARDAAGNTATASFTVTVKNSVEPTTCTDPSAENFNGPLPCTYPPPAAAPGAPTLVAPGDGSSDVQPGVTLSWSAAGATEYVLRLGTANPPADVVAQQAASTFAPSLQHATTYYWQVDARNATGTTPGPVWSFTTGAAPPPPLNNTALKRLRVITWNVQFGYTLQKAHDFTSQVDLLASLNPDVVVLQEVTLADGDMPGIYEQKLEERTGKDWHRHFVQFVTGAPLANSQGNLILTWLPVDQASSKVACAVPNDDRKISENSCTPFVTLAVTVNSVPLTITGVHLSASNNDYRTFQLNELSSWVGTLGPHRLIAGDFNMDPTDALWVTWAGHTDVWAAVVGTTADPGYTKDQRTGLNVPGRIDYMFIPAATTRIGVQTFAVMKTSLSDHHLVVGDYIIK